MSKNRCILILVLVLWNAGGLRDFVQAQDFPPTASPEWVPAEEPESDIPAEDLPPLDEPAVGEPEDIPFGEPVPAEPPVTAPIDLPMPVPVPAPAPPARPKPKAQPPKPRAETFRVRFTEAGKGFRQGVAGQLRVTASGLAFTRDGGAGTEWSIAWKDLEAARKEAGLWDAPFVLGLVERGGRRRYLARLDPEGTYVEGGPILAAIVRSGGTRFK